MNLIRHIPEPPLRSWGRPSVSRYAPIRDYALIGDCHGAALAQSSHLILRNATITGSDYALWVDSSAAEVYARR